MLHELRSLPAFLLGLSLTGVCLPSFAQTAPGPAPVATSMPSPADDLLSKVSREKAASQPETPRLKRASPEAAHPGTAFFALNFISVEGSRAVSEAELMKGVKKYIGRPVSQQDLSDIAERMTAVYRAAGYHLSRVIVPPQDVQGGRLVLRAIEGRIEDVSVKGGHGDVSDIKKALASISQEQPSRLKTLERSLLLLNERPGTRVVDTTLDEIEPSSGRFRLVVTIDTWSVFAAVGVDNMGSRSSGPQQVYGSVFLNSFFSSGDSFSTSFNEIPGAPRELRLTRMSYDIPLGVDSWRGGVSASRSDVRPGDERQLVGTHSRTDVFDAHASFAPVLTQRHSLWLSTSVALNKSYEDTIAGGVYRDQFATITLGADYKGQFFSDSWTYLSAFVRRGTPYSGSASDPLLPISRGSLDFTVARATASHYQTLFGALSTRLVVSGQWASQPLPLSQQFNLGGNSFGRGFDAGLLAGDRALAGTAELRYDFALKTGYMKSMQLFSFVEGGAVTSLDRTFDKVDRLASAGVGVRATINDKLEASVAVARPIYFQSLSPWMRGTTMLFSLSSVVRACPGRGKITC